MQESLSRKKAVRVPHKFRFLLDENISNNLKKNLISSGHDVITAQDLNKRVVNNSELMEIARMDKRILITYDKNFVFLNIKSIIT